MLIYIIIVSNFIVLYNAQTKYPKYNKLYLSNAFYDKLNLNLELLVDVININYKENHNLVEKSNTLNGYSYSIYLIRKYIGENKNNIEKSKY